MGYTPQIINGGYVLFAAQASECPLCKKLMVKRVGKYRFESSFFSSWINMDQDAQMKNAGLVYLSDVKVNDEHICEECEKSGKATFKCQLCGEDKPTNMIQESFGYPADFLCSDCYETVSAKTWNEKCDQLEAWHSNDFD